MFQDLSTRHASSNKTFIEPSPNHSISEDDLEPIDSVPTSNSPSKSTSGITKDLTSTKNHFLKRFASALSPISKQKSTKNKQK